MESKYDVLAFIKSNKDRLWFKKLFVWDGTTDSITNVEEEFKEAGEFSSRDVPNIKEGGKYQKWEDNDFTGYLISRYGYGFIIAIRKNIKI
jgi:hypothetical protein